MIKNYSIRSTFGRFHMILAQTRASTWSAAIITLNKDWEFTYQLIHADTEQAALSMCRLWIDDNVEKGAELIVEAE